MKDFLTGITKAVLIFKQDINDPQELFCSWQGGDRDCLENNIHGRYNFIGQISIIMGILNMFRAAFPENTPHFKNCICVAATEQGP